MVGDPELNSFFKNNPIQSSGLLKNYPLKVVATHKTIIEDQPFGNRPLGTSSTCRNLPCTRGKGSRRRSSLRRRMHCKKGIHSVGVATQICSALPVMSQTLTSLTLARGEARTTKIPGVGPNLPIKFWLLPPTVRWTLALNAVRLSMGTPSRTAMRANAQPQGQRLGGAANKRR